jgi:DNA-binding YbaB/EbfC family protein
MTGSFGEMGNLLKQAQEMQRQLDKLRAELAKTTVDGSSGGGAVRVTVTCDRHVQKISIADEVIASGDKSLVEDMVLGALRDAMQKAEQLSQETVTKVTGGMVPPGMF